MGRRHLTLLRRATVLLVPLVIALLVIQPKPAFAFTTLGHDDYYDGSVWHKYVGYANYDGALNLSDNIWPVWAQDVNPGQVVTQRFWLGQTAWDNMGVLWETAYHTRWFGPPQFLNLGGFQTADRMVVTATATRAFT